MTLSWTFLWTRWGLAPLDWTAAATLATGVLAVWAARHVGKQQADILKQQNELKESEIKLALLDKRIEIIGKIEFFGDLLFPQGADVRREIDAVEELIKAIRLAELTYPEELHSDLRSLIDRAIRFRSAHRKHNANFNGMKEEEIRQSVEALSNEGIAIGEAIGAVSRRLVAHARVDL